MSTSNALYKDDKELVSRHEVTLTRGSQRSYAICVQRVTVVNGRIVKTPIDILAGEIRLAVTNVETGEVVFEKTSATPSQITIRDPQEGADIGKADIHFIASDTEEMDPAGCYSIEIWAILASGERDTVLDPSPFIVVERETPINDSPAAPAPVGDPAPQTEQERSFLWTWSATGDTDVVTIPLGGAMRDASYCVHAIIEDVPVGGGIIILAAPSAGRTTTTFTLQGASDLLVGTTISIILRDRA